MYSIMMTLAPGRDVSTIYDRPLSKCPAAVLATEEPRFTRYLQNTRTRAVDARERINVVNTFSLAERDRSDTRHGSRATPWRVCVVRTPLPAWTLRTPLPAFSASMTPLEPRGVIAYEAPLCRSKSFRAAVTGRFHELNIRAGFRLRDTSTRSRFTCRVIAIVRFSAIGILRLLGDPIAASLVAFRTRVPALLEDVVVDRVPFSARLAADLVIGVSRARCVSMQLCPTVKGKPLRCIVYHVARGSRGFSGGLPEDYRRILLLPDNTV